ncbi:unnamed protein product, partial [Coregonus sp. 'balchen']
KKNKVIPKGKATKKSQIKKDELEPTRKHHQEEGFDSLGESLPVEVLVNIFKMNAAAASPALWSSVSVDYCWLKPGKTQLPITEFKIRNSIVPQSCLHPRSLKLPYCTGVTEKAFQSLSGSCR